MSALLLKPNHLKDLPAAMAEDITSLFKMQLHDDVHQQVAIEIIAGKPLLLAIRHARAQVKRENRSCAFVSLDSDDEDTLSLYERIACSDPLEIFDGLRECKTRLKVFDSQSETVLETLRNDASKVERPITGKSVLSARRKQQIVAKNIEAQVSARRFHVGEKGQGTLFDFDGSIHVDEVDHE